jgi:hypothetical protein
MCTTREDEIPDMQVKDDVILARDSNPGTVAGPATTSADAPTAGLTSQNTVTGSHLASSLVTEPCALDVHWESGACVATFDGLSAAQAYGLACVVCGEHFDGRALQSVPVGIAAHGGKVFACPGCAEAPVEDGGLGFDPADGWQGARP